MIVDIVDIIWHGDCNDELLTGNIDVGRNMPIELALFGVWTIHFWSHYHHWLDIGLSKKWAAVVKLREEEKK